MIAFIASFQNCNHDNLSVLEEIKTVKKIELRETALVFCYAPSFAQTSSTLASADEHLGASGAFSNISRASLYVLVEHIS